MTDTRLVSEYAENIKHHCISDNRIVFTSLGKAVGVIQNGKFQCADPFWLEVFEKYIAITPIADMPTEDEYRNSIAFSLRQQGWIVVTEQYTPQGRIDILAERNNEQHIIETKLRGFSNDAAHALGQLLFYAKFFPNARLWFASPQKPDQAILDILNSFNVRYYSKGAI